MAIDVAALARASQAAAEAMRWAEQELNAADARLGDGDTGVTMRRVFQRIAEAAQAPTNDLGEALRKMGSAAAGATGSSLGTLIAVGLLEAGGLLRGKTAISEAELPSLLRAAETKMLARGGAALGDKTVLDAIDAVASGLETAREGDAGPVAVHAARSALDVFRHRPCRVGRARIFADRSVGLDDPGMLAFLRLVEGVPGEPTGRDPNAHSQPSDDA